MEIESKEIISHDESRVIIELFFKYDFNFDKVIANHKSKHSPDQIITHVKCVFRKIILDMEYELMVSEKIKNMQLTENNTLEMFDYLLKLDQVLTQEQISDMAIYYKNRVSRVTIYQTDLICSDKRLAIYNSFVNYAIDHDLFRFSIVDKSKPSTYNIPTTQFYENPMVIYPSQGLELVYQVFSDSLWSLNNSTFMNSEQETNTNAPQAITLVTPSMEKQIRKDGRYTTPKYFGEMLQKNLRNLFLIGLYRVYKLAMHSSTKITCGWQNFIFHYSSVLDLFDLTWKGVLMRIAIFNDSTIPQKIYISKIISSKKTAKSKSKPNVPSPTQMGIKSEVSAKGISFGKETRVDRQIKRKRAFMISKVKQEMAKIIKANYHQRYELKEEQQIRQIYLID